MASDITIGRLIYEFVADTARFVRDTVDVNGRLAGLANTVKNNSAAFHQVGLAATAAGGAIAAGLGFAISKAVTFDQAARNAFSIINDGKTTIETVRDVTMEWGRTTVFTATQAADAYYKLASAGLSANQIQQAGADVIKFAVATAQDFDSAAETLTGTIKGLGLEFTDTGAVANTFAAAIQGSQLNAERLAGGLKYATPVAASFGLGVNELASYLMIMNDNMLLGEMGGRAIEQSFRALSKVAPETEKKLEEYGVKLDDVAPKSHTLAEITKTLAEAGIGGAEAFEIFGSEGGRALSILLNGLENNSALFDDYLAKLDNASALQSAYNKQMEGAENIAALFRSALEFLQITIGDTLLPTVKTITIHLTDFVAQLGSYLRDHQKITTALVAMAVAFGGILSAIGPILLVLPGLVTMLGSLSTVAGIVAGVFSGPVLIAIAALVAAGALFYTQWEKIKDLWVIAEEAFTGFVSAVIGDGEAFKVFWMGLWSYVKDAFSEVWDWVIAYFDFIMERVQGFDQMIKDTFGSWETFFQFVGEIIRDALTALMDMFQSFFGSVLSGLQIFVDTFTGSVDTIIKSANWLLEKVGMEALPLIGGRFRDWAKTTSDWVGAGKAAVISAFNAINKRGQEANEESKKELSEYSHNVQMEMEKASGAFVNHSETVGNAMGETAKEVAEEVGKIVNTLQGYGVAVDDTMDKVESKIKAVSFSIMYVNPELRESFDETYAAIQDSIQRFYRGLSTEEQALDRILDALKLYALESGLTMKAVAEQFSEALGEMKDDVDDAVGASWFTDGVMKFIDLFSRLKDSAKDSLGGLVDAAKENLGDLKETLVGINDSLADAGLPIGDLLPGGGGNIPGLGGGGSNPIGIEQPVGDPMKNRGGTSNPIFFVSQLVVREEVDIHKIAQQLAFQMQTQGAL